MRVISATVKNFSSYEELSFSFENQGLTLIQGPTGSGKSTLCDIVPWILFGKTAKDGSVDEVLRWQANMPTEGTLHLEVANGATMTICRVRSKTKNNDLYYTYREASDNLVRGKDIPDTQRLINEQLGFDSNLYLSGAYFHEFSQTSQFFITTTKNRRAFCEQLVDLSLAKRIQTDVSKKMTKLKEQEKEYAKSVHLYADRVQLLSLPNNYANKSKTFEVDKNAKLIAIEFEIEKLTRTIKDPGYYSTKYADLKEQHHALGEGHCSQCGAKTHSEERAALQLKLAGVKEQERINNQNKLKVEQLLSNYKEVEKSENTYGLLLEKNKKDLESAETSLIETSEKHNQTLQSLSDCELLLETISSLRSYTIKNTIKDLENHTNKLLSEHFDAEIKVLLEVVDSDKLDVSLLKDGNPCSYSQLSKGQRQLLKFCFGVATMRCISHHVGVQFNAVFFDEALDGLDDVFKVKAFHLLQTLGLEYSSIFVVEHSASLKAMFANTYHIQLTTGASGIHNE